jgi:voltage-gated potassium channel
MKFIDPGQPPKALIRRMAEEARWRVKVPLLLLRRTAQPFLLFAAVFIGGTFGFYALGAYEGRQWSMLECAYMTTISITTVGYGDPLGAGDTDVGKMYMMFLIVTGMGTALYAISSLTAFIVEGYLGTLFREARMERKVDHLEDHTIICGAGTTGIHVIEEHVRTGHPFVVIERDLETLARLQKEYPDQLLIVTGDATNEETLVRAGLGQSSTLVAALGSDKDNLFLLVTARYMRKDVNIVAKCLDHDSLGKFTAAGANYVVSPTFIGGMRIASQVLRPHVVHFLDEMLTDRGNARVSEVAIHPESELAGKKIAETDLARKVGLLIVALRHVGQESFVYSPDGDHVLEPGCIVVVIGPVGRVQLLEKLARPR